MERCLGSGGGNLNFKIVVNVGGKIKMGGGHVRMFNLSRGVTAHHPFFTPRVCTIPQDRR